MINRIEFKNYKSFESGEIEIKPITILLGTNSSGKSSIIQFLMMLKQTVNNFNNYESALKLNGKYINLGENENIFRNKKTAKNLKFKIDLNSSSNSYYLTDLKYYKRNTENQILDLYYQLSKLDERVSPPTKIKNTDFELPRGENIEDYNFESIEREIRRLRNKLKKINFSYDNIVPTGLNKSNAIIKNLKFQEKEIKYILNSNLSDLFDSYYLLKTIIQNMSQNFNIEYEIEFNQKKNVLNIIEISIRKEDTILLNFTIKSNKGQKKYILGSDIIENKVFEKYRVTFGKNVKFDKLSIEPTSDEIFHSIYAPRLKETSNYFCNVILNIFSYYTKIFAINFSTDKINYVSPLRAFPKRYYFLDESNASNSLDSIDGDSLTETLKKHTSLVAKVNNWFEKFGLSVDVEDVKEVIHRLKINQNGLSLDITDVGFGISQVLPIIVQGFLSKQNSLTIIEQPEIHLHPMMQAELADLFIDVVGSNNPIGKRLIIETHSESLLKRLRRRIAEGVINNKDIAIYFVHGKTKKTNSAIIEKIDISETGAFEWPLEFYSTDFEDTKEFLKHQL